MEPVSSFIAGELLKAVKDVAMKNIDFKNCCQSLQSTLEALIPILQGVAYNLLSDGQQKPFKEFHVKLQTGKTLLQKCSNVSQLNVVLIYKYVKEIERFDKDIVKFTQTIGWALSFREVHEINNDRANLGAKFDEMRDKFAKLERDVSETLQRLMGNVESAFPSSIGELKKLKKLEKLLLSEDVRLVGDLEMGSSSNTALLTAFRNDKEFQGMMKQNPGRQFDVFINHRGVDVRNLASFIYALLTFKHPNLRVFFDGSEIPLGVDIQFEIETAIQSSSVHVVIFSKRYAESRWCLNELDLIIKSKRKLIPIFCDVNPAALRDIEKGCYREAFEKHGRRESAETTKRWEDALARASDLQGLSLKMNEEEMGVIALKIARIVSMNFERKDD